MLSQEESTTIQKAFDDLVSCISHNDDDERYEETVDSFYDLFDFCYDTESWISPDSLEAAFALGQRNPQENRYGVWWGSTICWFIGNETSILNRIKVFKDNLPK